MAHHFVHPKTSEQICPARKLALMVLVEVERKGAYVNLSLREQMSRKFLKPKLRDMSTGLAMGVVKMRLYLDHIIRNFCKYPLNELSAFTRNILRMAAYELIFFNHSAPIVGNEYVKLAKRFEHKGIAALVNAIVRVMAEEWQKVPIPSLDENPVEHISITTSHPQWMVSRWVKFWGIDETLALCQANNEPPPLCIRVNMKYTDRDLVAEMLKFRCKKVEPSPFVPECLRIEAKTDVTSLPGFTSGLFTIQDEGAMVISYLLDPKPGEVIIDACAAPGGKATHIAELTKDEAEVIAIDLHPSRLKLVEENAQRLKLLKIKPLLGDWNELARQFINFADKVLLDVPCSGTGTLRRKVDARWRKSEEVVKELTEIQMRLLESSAPVVKKGGVIVYSTCSLEPEEDEELIKAFLERHQEFVLEDPRLFLPAEIPKAVTKEGFLKLFPQKHNTDGVFAARLKKVR
ncbi:MAG: 16S rRNA (cytosine(967)-C(5))-methyltransferase RsmB [Armatimonadetes bacterium]|nr:16S rRNA (cytosine(967)-C(5))-methyltransferase RsmB [Armatimonadota bacterium]MDW8027018.1 16S rRNA (cytosine(967)-C(5))-methyltransferase RsmB [Armatimonadota bacterium]